MDMQEFLASKPKVGQKVFVCVLDRINRVKEDFAEEVVIASVGSKYFTLEGDRFANIRFFNKYKTEQSKFITLIKIYPNRKEYEDEKTRRKARFDIEEAVRYGALDKLDIEDVNLICELLQVKGFQKKV